MSVRTSWAGIVSTLATPERTVRPVRFVNVVVPPYTDEDLLSDKKFRDIVDVRLFNALANANVKTVSDLRDAYDTGRLRYMKNIGSIGRARIRLLLGVSDHPSKNETLADSLVRAPSGDRVSWFRDFGAALRRAGFKNSLVDELEGYSE